MIKNQSLYQLSITCKAMNHMHNLDHVQVNRFVSNSDDIDRIDDDINQLIS